MSITLDGINGAEKIKEWLRDGLGKEAIQYAENFGQNLTAPNGEKKQALSTSQIRNVYGEVKRMQMKGFSENDLLLLKPRLAYSAKRAKNRAATELKDVLSAGIDAVVEAETVEEKQKRFENFANFFEAILAYHKAYGGN